MANKRTKAIVKATKTAKIQGGLQKLTGSKPKNVFGSSFTLRNPIKKK